MNARIALTRWRFGIRHTLIRRFLAAVLFCLVFVNAQAYAASMAQRLQQPTFTTLTSADTIPLASTVLVVYNTLYPESLDVANYYMTARGIPNANKCAITVSGDVNYFISYAEYTTNVKAPIRTCLNELGRDNILYIVFTYMTPFKLYDSTGHYLSRQYNQTCWYIWPDPVPEPDRSIDSLIANIWNEDDRIWKDNPYSGSFWCQPGSAANIYEPFISLADFRAENPSKDIYSVWRIDAGSAAQANGLVDKAISAETTGIAGQGCFDRRYPNPLGPDNVSYPSGDWDIQKAYEFVQAGGFPAILDINDAEFGTAPAPARCDNASFFVGWYQYGHYNDVFSWPTGAMGWHYDSLGLSSPREPTTSWAGGAIARGITVTTGAMGEPALEGIPHYDGFIKNVLAGANVGDAMLRNTENIDWKIINVGDPLYRPFARSKPPDNEAPTVNAGLDQTITFPSAATLSGTATDDGLPNPPAAITFMWSQVSGQGTVDFAAAGALNTQATFAAAGSYVLRLTASDSVLSAADDIQIVVNNDLTPPVISNVIANEITVNAAVVRWMTTNELSSSQVEYGLTSGYGSITILDPTLVTTHAQGVSGLASNTLYHYRVLSKDASGNQSVSGDVTFTTLTTADTTPPTVAITAPANGATVLSAIAVVATASDNVEVAGVQFKVDGAATGAEVTSAPYAYSLNTLLFYNGDHTITAVARDASGNRATSADVSVTVNNGNMTLPAVSQPGN